MCWKPWSSCSPYRSFTSTINIYHLVRRIREFLSAPIHSPPLWFAVSVLHIYHQHLPSCSPYRRIFIGSHSLPPSLVRRIGPSHLPSRLILLPSQAHGNLAVACCAAKRVSWIKYSSKARYLALASQILAGKTAMLCTCNNRSRMVHCL
jgi:hypothetical protein